MINTNIINLLKEKSGIMLDVGCGDNKQKGFMGMDKRDLDNVDIIHDLEEFPFPLPDECCTKILGSHIFEHIKPWLTIDFMNELWRIMKWDGSLIMTMPYAGSFGYYQDPTHCNPCNEATFEYFDPDRNEILYNIYKPNPWKLRKGYPTYQPQGFMEVIMDKVKFEEDTKGVDE